MVRYLTLCHFAIRCPSDEAVYDDGAGASQDELEFLLDTDACAEPEKIAEDLL